jgi:hypothetical protein
MTKPIYTPLGTASWCDLQTPQLFDGKKRWDGDLGRYSVTLCFDPDDPKFQEFKAKVAARGDELFSEMDAQAKKRLTKADTRFLPIEEEEDEEGSPTGRMLVKASLNAGGITQSGPREGQKWTNHVVLVDHNNKAVEYDEDLGRGTKMIVSLNPKAYNVVGSKGEVRVKFEIRAAMIISPEFRARKAVDDFADMEVDAEEFGSSFAASGNGDF